MINDFWKDFFNNIRITRELHNDVLIRLHHPIRKIHHLNNPKTLMKNFFPLSLPTFVGVFYSSHECENKNFRTRKFIFRFQTMQCNLYDETTLAIKMYSALNKFGIFVFLSLILKCAWQINYEKIDCMKNYSIHLENWNSFRQGNQFGSLVMDNGFFGSFLFE